MPLPTLLRILAIAAALLPAVADARPAYITEPIRLHAGPGPDYPQIAVLPPGMEIDVVGCLQGYQWCDLVTPDGFRGWAWSGALSFSWAGEPLPIIQYGPSFGIPLISFIIGDYWGHHYRDRPWYGERHNWRHAPPPPALYRPPPPRFAPHPGPAPGWQPGWNPGRDHEREHRWQDDRRRDGPRDDYRHAPPRQERERAPRQEPPPDSSPIAPPRAAPQPTPGGWGQQNAPRQEAPRMEAPRPPGEPNSRFRPPPGMDNQRGHGGDGGRGQENRFGGRQ